MAGRLGRVSPRTGSDLRRVAVGKRCVDLAAQPRRSRCCAPASKRRDRDLAAQSHQDDLPKPKRSAAERITEIRTLAASLGLNVDDICGRFSYEAVVRDAGPRWLCP